LFITHVSLVSDTHSQVTCLMTSPVLSPSNTVSLSMKNAFSPPPLILPQGGSKNKLTLEHGWSRPFSQLPLWPPGSSYILVQHSEFCREVRALRSNPPWMVTSNLHDVLNHIWQLVSPTRSSSSLLMSLMVTAASPATRYQGDQECLLPQSVLGIIHLLRSCV
jgi:hypothetical protein